MADAKISALDNLTSADPANDMIPIVDVSATPPASGNTKRISINNLLACSPSATLASATITGAATVGTTLGVTGVSTFAAGTALLPALTTTGDTNTGIYYPAADTFAVTTGGTERYRVDSTGLGIGVTPQAKLHAYTLNPTDGVIELLQNLSTSGQTGAKTKYEVANVGASGIGTPNGTTNALAFFVGGITSAEERARIDASGNLLTGTTSTGGSASNATKTVGGSFSTVNGVSASTATAVAVTLFAVPTEAVFIVSAFVPAYAAPTLYNAVSIVKVNGGVATVTDISTATNLSIAVSGLNVQATQLTGGASTISYSAIRIS